MSNEELSTIPEPIAAQRYETSGSYRYEPFAYYRQSLGELVESNDSNYWSTVMDPANRAYTLGILFKNKDFVWSTEVPIHAALAEAVQADDDDYAVRLQANWERDTEDTEYEWIQLHAEENFLPDAHQIAQFLAQNVANQKARLGIRVKQTGPDGELNFPFVFNGTLEQYALANDASQRPIRTADEMPSEDA